MHVFDEVIAELKLDTTDDGPHEMLTAKIFSVVLDLDPKKGRSWELQINGRYVGGYASRAAVYRLLSGVLLKLSTRDDRDKCENVDCESCKKVQSLPAVRS